jgi:hypothetical protein
MPTERLNVFAAGPAGYAGAGRIMCNALVALADAGHHTEYVGRQMPVPLASRPDRSTRVRLADAVLSAAIGEGSAVPQVGYLDTLLVSLRDGWDNCSCSSSPQATPRPTLDNARWLRRVGDWSAAPSDDREHSDVCGGRQSPNLLLGFCRRD